jgi:hypothetical protein
MRRAWSVSTFLAAARFFVALMFNMPGPHLMRMNNAGGNPQLTPNNNPPFVHQALNAKLPSCERMLRNWEMAKILVEILGRAGTANP